MGEVADDAIAGRTCEWCGVWLADKNGELLVSTGNEHGHPVVCTDCWNDASPADREGCQKEYLGVTA